MERRAIADRRQVHMFFANDRRTGPHDRRGADIRREQRAKEIKKIKALMAYKEKEQDAPAKSSTLTRKRIAYIGVVLAIVVIVIAMLTT